jgi:hypothetical protein
VAGVVGPIVIVVVLLLIPVATLMAGGVAAALLDAALTRDAEVRHAGSELIDLNR